MPVCRRQGAHRAPPSMASPRTAPARTNPAHGRSVNLPLLGSVRKYLSIGSGHRVSHADSQMACVVVLSPVALSAMSNTRWSPALMMPLGHL